MGQLKDRLMTRSDPFGVIEIVASILLGIIVLPQFGVAKEIDLTKAVVVVPDGLSGPENKATRLLVEEVRKRSRIEWTVSLTLADCGSAGDRRRARAIDRVVSSRTSRSDACSRSGKPRKDSPFERPPSARGRRCWQSLVTTSEACSSALDACSASCT